MTFEDLSLPRRSQLKKYLSTPFFWGIVVTLAVVALFHYLTPQVRLLPLPLNTFLRRHAVERIIFLIPVVGATFAFGRAGGNITLLLVILFMLPRAIWLSPFPVDALVEVGATALLGYLVTWGIGDLAREKDLRQKVIAQLRAVNEVTAIVTESLELERVLDSALGKTLDVTGSEAGLIFLLDQHTQELVLATHQGVSEKLACDVDRLKLGEGFCGRVAQSGESMIVHDSSRDPRLTRLVVREEGLRSQVIVPLKSQGKVRGVLAMMTRKCCEFPIEDLELVTAIGNQIGVAVENAQLHEDVARQLRIQRQLSSVAEKITSELELEKILPKVLRIAEDLVGAECGFIALFDPVTQRIRFPYLHNLPPDLRDVSVLEGSGLSGEVLDSGYPRVVEDYRTYVSAIPDFVEVGLRSVVAVPIVSGNRSFGALGVGTLRDGKTFSMLDATTLVGVGRQAGIAIDNARLYENMRYYARQITRAQEKERKRISREAHDETAQIIVALSRRLDGLLKALDPPCEVIRSRLEQLRELAVEALQSVRRFSKDLRPPVLDDLGFVAAVESLASDLEAVGLETTFETSGFIRRLAPEEELVLFRIVQEALNNARRHADASSVMIKALFRPSSVRLTIEDDGKGFDAPDRFVDLVASGKLGLIGMHERAWILDGVLQVRSEPGGGTIVSVEAPVQSLCEGENDES